MQSWSKITHYEGFDWTHDRWLKILGKMWQTGTRYDAEPPRPQPAQARLLGPENPKRLESNCHVNNSREKTVKTPEHLASLPNAFWTGWSRPTALRQDRASEKR